MKYKKCYTEDIWTPDHFKRDMTNWLHNEISRSKKVCCGSLQDCDRRDSHEKLSPTVRQIQNKETSNDSLATTITSNECTNCEIIASCICSNSLESCSSTNLLLNIVRSYDACTCFLSVTSANGEALSTEENTATDKLHYKCAQFADNKSLVSVNESKKMSDEEDRLAELDQYCQYKDWEKIYKVSMKGICEDENLTDDASEHYASSYNDDLIRPHRNNEMHADLNDNIFININRTQIMRGHCMLYKECICHDNDTIV